MTKSEFLAGIAPNTESSTFYLLGDLISPSDLGASVNGIIGTGRRSTGEVVDTTNDVELGVAILAWIAGYLHIQL